jgi:hypothetical protein
MSSTRSEIEVYDQLVFYTLSLGDAAFIHQHIVDAWAAQHPEGSAKTIRTAFALIGLYLSLEKNYTGKEVQRAHTLLARNKRQWPGFTPPTAMSKMTVYDVMDKPAGPARDKAIMNWCAAIWVSWAESHAKIKELVKEELGNV